MDRFCATGGRSMARGGIIAVARLALITTLLAAAEPLGKAHCSTPCLQHREVAEGNQCPKPIAHVP